MKTILILGAIIVFCALPFTALYLYIELKEYANREENEENEEL